VHPQPPLPPNATVAERVAAGKAARADAPRTSHGDWTPAADRRDPVAILEEQAQTRVKQLVPIRYGRMLQSPFAFFRGGAAIMAADLAPTPVAGQRVQLCGDAHLSNFGVFASPERELLFDLNDFDETLPGPWEYDVKRLAASALIASRQNGHGVDDQIRVAQTVGSVYREGMRQLAAQGNLDVWYAKVDADEIVGRLETSDADAARMKALRKGVTKARRKNSLRAFEKLTVVVDGRPQIISDPPLVVPLHQLWEEHGDGSRDPVGSFAHIVDAYRDSLPPNRRGLFDSFELHDIAFKVVGVGSVGTRAWIMLFSGRDTSDPLFMQAKEAGPSVLEPYAGASEYATHGQRVVHGQRLMQTAGDILLGWMTVVGLDGISRDFYARQLWDGKGSADVESMDPETLVAYSGLCAWTMARAHARTGDRVAIAAYLGAKPVFDEALARFSQAYADQNELDHAALRAAVDAGRVVAGDALR
jgi:uncharacterized protein (DUF2252 family)